MPTARKEQTVGELAALLKKSPMVVLTDYRGMKVSELSDIRRQMRAKGMEYHIAKNTLAVLAAQQAGIEMTSAMREQLNGPTALVFMGDDIAAGSKLLNDYLRTARVMKVKSALLDGKLVEAKSLEDIAKLPGRQQLIGQIASAFNAPIANLASVLNASISGLANALKQVLDKMSGDAAPIAEAATAEAA